MQLESLRPVLNAADVVEIQQAVAQVHVDGVAHHFIC